MLGPRLRAIADRVLPGLPVGDLCCDHAMLAIALVRERVVPSAIAVDIHAPPLVGAAARVAELGLDDRVDLRHGDGCLALHPSDHVATVVIAGVGAELAARILVDGHAGARLDGVRRAIVQVNQGFPKLGSLRAVIDGLGWSIVDEAIASEHAQLYPILVAEPGTTRLRDEADRELGPILRGSDDPLVIEWFTRERRRIAKALVGMDTISVDADLLAHYRRYVDLLDH